jgi:8-oxo-dGTP diphosphatase
MIRPITDANTALPPLIYTVGFLTRGDEVLMLLRNKPPNQGLWNGVGGHIEPGEGALACILREVEEETGYRLASARFCGLLTWEGFEIPPAGLYIFTAPAPQGEPRPNSEGILEWKPRSWVFTSPEAVSNIHLFGPPALSGAQPQVYHFVYQNGEILRYEVRPCPYIAL